MDILAILLRLLHIILGVFWAGTAFFNVLILEPRLRWMGPAFQNPVMNALIPVIGPMMTLSSFVVLGTGVALSLMSWTTFGALFSTSTGWMLFAGFAFTIGAMAVGLGFIAPTGKRLERLSKTLEGRVPGPDETLQLAQLSGRIETLSRLNSILLLLAVGTMVLFRYI
ncbi:MAG TPA: hypothetical protein VJ508_16325 [Saprospiraceae bacterium]|nr:hypothetical protein [Saprospiraceae bacterium]